MKAARFLLLLTIALCALPARADDFTIPPAPTQRVTDPSGALSSKTRTALENQLAAYEKATGHQVIVWIGQTTGNVPLETFTTATADRWKIGRRGHDDGAVLFLFMQDRKIRLEVGYGLEGKLTDAAAFHIINDVIRPRMRSGDVDGAVTAGVASMLTTITPSYALSLPSPSPAPTEGTLPTWAGALIFGVIAMGFILVLVVIVGNVVTSIRYGYLVMREGSKQARKDMQGWWFFGGGGGSYGGGGWSMGGGGGGFGGGFSGGGGGFGGGGASGGW